MPLSSYSSLSCSQDVHLQTVCSNCSSHHPSHLHLQAAQSTIWLSQARDALPYCRNAARTTATSPHLGRNLVSHPSLRAVRSRHHLTRESTSTTSCSQFAKLQIGCVWRCRTIMRPQCVQSEHLLDMGMSALVFSSGVCRNAWIWGLSGQSICRGHHRRPPPARRLTVAFLAVRYADQVTLRTMAVR